MPIILIIVMLVAAVMFPALGAFAALLLWVILLCRKANQ